MTAATTKLIIEDDAGKTIVVPFARDEITIGQAIPGNRVDVPILADLRGRHAVIRREQEQYLIEPLSDDEATVDALMEVVRANFG